MLVNQKWNERTRIILQGLCAKIKSVNTFTRRNNIPVLPKSSDVLKAHLLQRNCPPWTAW